MEIVQLVPEDWATFRALRLAAVADAPYAFSSTLAWERQHDEAGWRARLATRTQFAARDGEDHWLGTAGAFGDGPSIDLVSMWVAPDARGRGIGAALVERVIEHARAIGAGAIYLMVTEGNTAAAQLYARCGFAWTGVVQPVRFGEPRTEREMVLRL